MATGEAQIAGQVRRALLAAGEAGGVAPRLSRLFHTALRTARRIRQATGVEKDSISIPSIGVQLLKQTLDELSGQSVLLIGAGEDGDDDRTRPSAQRRAQVDSDQPPHPPRRRVSSRAWRHGSGVRGAIRRAEDSRRCGRLHRRDRAGTRCRWP